MTRDERARARVRLLVARPADDRATTMADLRTALALAAGVPVRHIDPASGHDLSPRAYRAARAGWVAVGDPAVVARSLGVWLVRAPAVVAAVEAVDPLPDPAAPATGRAA